MRQIKIPIDNSFKTYYITAWNTGRRKESSLFAVDIDVGGFDHFFSYAYRGCNGIL